MAQVLSHCPVCTSGLHVAEVACDHCQTRIRSRFDLCRFCRLSPEHSAFLETFLLCEGNLSRMGEELGLSYPTIRNRLTTALNAFRALQVESSSAIPLPNPETTARRRLILEQVALGETSAEAASQLLRELG